MADEIKIHLVSVLDDAGYKASSQKTKEVAKTVEAEIERILAKRREYERSIEGMAKKTIQNMDKQKALAEELRNKLEELPGPIGKIITKFLQAHDGLAKFAAKSVAVVAAFKVGWDIGTWINDKVVKPILGIKDPIEELRKANRRAAKEAQEAAEKWMSAQDAYIEKLGAENAAMEKTISAIDRKTQAYIRMQDALKAVQDAQGDGEMLGLQRDKFEDMLTLQRDGNTDAAAQVGKYYDVLIAEEKAKKSIADIDQRIINLEATQEAETKKLETARRREAEAKKQVEETYAKRKAFDEDDEETWSAYGKNYEKAVAKLEAMHKKAMDNLANATRQREDAENNVNVNDVKLAELDITRDNAKRASEIEIDERKKAYDDFLDSVQKKEEDEAAAVAAKRVEMMKQEADARRRQEEELARQRISDLQNEIAESTRMQNEAKSRQSAAAGSLSQAWGWYRDKNQMQAVLDEQKAQADAEMQWQKDFDRLKSFRKDWRTVEFGKLSAADESVRQVALAKEAKAEADKAVIETAENTRELANKLDELLMMK